MSKGAARAGLILLEAVAIVIAVIAAGGAFLYWRLGQGPVSLGVFKPGVERAIERRLPAQFHCGIERLELSRDKSGGVYHVQLSGLSISDDQDAETASADSATVSFAARDLLSGKAGPQTIVAEGASVRIVRNAHAAVAVPAAPRRRGRGPVSISDLVLDRGLFGAPFQHGEIADAKVTFVDEASGRAWNSTDATVSFSRRPGGFDGVMRARIDAGGAGAAFNANIMYTDETDIIVADIDGENFPVGDILTMFYGDGAAIIDAPVSGKALITLDAEGAVLDSRISARVDGGFLNLGKRRAPIEFIEWETQFDPEAKTFAIDRLAFEVDGNRGALAGAATLAFGDTLRDPKQVAFELSGESLNVNLPGFLPGELPVERLSVAGEYDIDDRRIRVGGFDLGFLDIDAKGRITVTFPPATDGAAPKSLGVEGGVTIDGSLNPERLLKMWPLMAAEGAREWVEDRLAVATIGDINAEFALKPGAVGADGLIPDEAMTITFNARDATARYVKEMTPITDASGSGVLRGNSFFLKVADGRIGDIAISAGEVEFPVFIPKWRPTYIRFSAAGRSDALLALLDQAPLHLLEKINLSPDQFQGDAQARVEIMRPNKRDVPADEYRYSGTARFENMRVVGVAGDADLTGARGDVVLEPRSMTVSAAAQLADAPLDIVWTQNFFKDDGPSTMKMIGTLDASTGDLFGVASRQFVRGPVDIEAFATGEIGAFQSLDLKADLSAAEVSVDAFDWRKPSGASAAGRMIMSFGPDGLAVDAIDVHGEGISLSGSFALRGDGALRAANLDRFFLDGAVDLSLTAARNDADALVITAVGDFLKAGPLIERVIDEIGAADEPERSRWGSGVSLTARIGRMTARNGVAFGDTTLDFLRGADRLQALSFSAIDSSGAPLRVSMNRTGEESGPRQIIEARSNAIGDLLKGVLGLTSIGGGEGIMQIELGAPDQKGVKGFVEARDLTVAQAPLLARIFSAGSLDGLNNLLNGKGIDLTYAYGEFGFAEGVLSVNDFRATGPSVGMTAEGAVALGAGGKINLGGAVAPVYQLNSALGMTPIIGDILVGKKGEGLVALSYSVSGERASPSVFVNPLSALTPGIFRNIMQPQRGVSGNADVDETPGADEAPPEN